MFLLTRSQDGARVDCISLINTGVVGLKTIASEGGICRDEASSRL
jgi:hypothetical protein